ncbi:MAG TPA: 4Fe-4S binding protein [Actinomycetota bacterium]|nr:4Fe-4S binding protein [Actinomycetota bacterium]
MAVETRPPDVSPARGPERFTPAEPPGIVDVAGERYRRRSPLGIWLLTIGTLGIYALVWHYRVNDEARRYLRDPEILPGLSLLAFSLAGGAAVPFLTYLLVSDGITLWGSVLWLAVGLPFLVPPIISTYRTGERIARMQEAAERESTSSGLVGVLLMPALLAAVPYYQAELNLIWGSTSALPGTGLLKGLMVTLKHLLSRSVTQQYPKVKPELPPRTRGVISLKAENCTVCWKCSRECPDWCIYIESHKETHEPVSGGRARSSKVLDRFAIDYALCMYCGICVEVCPFDALFWSPEFEYSEYSIVNLIHEKEKLDEWNYTVLPPPALEEGAEPPEDAPDQSAAPHSEARTSVPPIAKPGVAEPAAAPEPAQPAAAAVQAPPQERPGEPSPAQQVEEIPAPGEADQPPHDRPPPAHVEPDQETYDRVLAEELEKGTSRRVAEGRAKSAAVRAARRKAQEGA